MVTDTTDVSDRGYTAVVYAHGMGSQRRFQELGRLLDALDTFRHRASQEGAALGQLIGIDAKEETWHPEVVTESGVSGQLPFVQLMHKTGTEGRGREVRLYEIYWADQMDEAGVTDIAKWIGLQALRPFRWWRAPWRSFHRLRRAVLAELYEKALSGHDRQSLADMGSLLQLYDDFDKLGAKRDYPKGDYPEFLAFIRDRTQGPEDRTEELIALAETWRKAARGAEWGNAAGILSLILAIGLLFAVVMWTVAQILAGLRDLIGGSSSGGILSWLLALLPEPSLLVLPGLVTSVVLALGLRSFLSRSLSDVAAWTTLAEAEKGYRQRKAVLGVGRSVMQQVLLDPACKRIVVIGHSLGTSVACDTVLALSRANRVRKSTNGPDPLQVPLDRISHLVTLASPIDKINYFFEQHVSGHRFARMLETLRGDLGEVPFVGPNGRPGLRWINFWDQADPISGALHSPVSRRNLEPRIENIHVASLRFPLPGRAHSAYFQNRTVIATLFDIIFRPDALPPKPDAGLSKLEPGSRFGFAKDIYRLALCVPWLAVLALIAYLLGLTNLVFGATFGVIVLSLGLFAAFLLGRRRSHDPL